jgi:hypothetical protein
MSMATLERVILAGAKIVFANPKLKLGDIQEWSSAEIEPLVDEVTFYIPDPGVWVAIKATNDKRKAAKL